MTPSHLKQTIRNIAALVLLVSACRNAPSRIAEVAPDTIHPSPTTTIQTAQHHSDGTKPVRVIHSPVLSMLGYEWRRLKPDTISLDLGAERHQNYFTAVGIATRRGIADRKRVVGACGKSRGRIMTTGSPTPVPMPSIRADSFSGKLLLKLCWSFFGNIDETSSSRRSFTVIKIEQRNEARAGACDQVTQASVQH